ncbi:MAG TPA: HAMP domain-containing sensor histidine kinase [Solirubrobacteraceae bacterium]|nr:HAMP domain-containing sensor histidine kinase [Solirubrobacteraceae bacterium]
MRLRLTALYVTLFGTAAGLLLTVAWWLMSRHLDRTLPAAEADAVADELALQFALAFAGTMVLAAVAGWLLAGRALAPLRRVTDTARRVSGERLDPRIGLEGSGDEVGRLAQTVDGMLDRLEESFEAQRRFVANASHELRTPLTLIRTEADVALADDRADAPRLREMGRAVVDGVDRTEALLDGLMTLARSQRGLVRPELTDLADCLRPAVALSAREAGAAGIELRIAAEPAAVRGDRPLLERLAQNLVENAVRYNRRGGTVWAGTGVDGGAAVLRVENTGPRLADSDVARLAEPFDRLGRHADGGGAGLGLSIARSVARAHEGELTLRARPEGGLVAEVRLPAYAPAAGSEAAVRRGGRTSAASRSRRPA